MPSAPILVSLDYGNSLASGTAEAGATVTLFLDPTNSVPAQELGQTTAAPDGTWTIDFAPISGDGRYSLFSRASDSSGDSGNSNAFRIELNAIGLRLSGSGNADEIIGSPGDDFLDTGGLLFGVPGTDTLAGGAGDDTYTQGFAFGGANQVTVPIIVEAPEEGIDLAIINDDFVLPDNVENLRGDRGGLELTGNELDNVIEVHRYEGGSTVTGGAGNDMLGVAPQSGDIFGRPNSPDNVAVYSGNRADYQITQLVDGFVIEDMRAGSPDGTDTVRFFDIFRFADGDIAGRDLVGDIGQPDVPVIDGFNAGTMELTGTAEAGSTLQLHVGNEPFGEPIIVPGDGRWSTVLPPLMHDPQGGAFRTTYDFVATATNANGMSAGSERLSIRVDSFDEVELVDAADADIAHTITGPLDSINGGGGNDTLIAAGNRFSRLSGEAGDDRLVGDDGENILDGGTGNDTMIGGRDGDTYIVDSTGDVIIENPKEGFDDAVLTGLQIYTLPENLEDLEGGTAAQELTGNHADNYIDGRSGDDLLRGMGGDDILQGSTGDDTLVGGPGNDFLGDVNEFGDRDVDVAVFSGNRSDYSVTEDLFRENTYIVEDLRSGSPDGEDTIGSFGSGSSIELFRFADGDVNLAGLLAGTTPSGFAPTAVDDYFLNTGDEPVVIDILANDTDPEGDPLSIQSIEQISGSAGTIVVNADNTITFSPDSFFSLSLEYLVADGTGGISRGVLLIEDNRDPFARNDTASTDAAVPVIIDVLANDTDSQPLTVSAVTMPSNGIVVVNGDNTVTYTPDAGFGGTDTFEYTADDGFGGTDTAIVTVTVIGPVNASPVAAADRAATAKDTPVTIAVLANDSDADGDDLAVTGASDPAGGSVVVNPGGTVTYTPDAGFRGQDSFTYTVSDGMGGSDTGSVSVQVGPAPIRVVAFEDFAGGIGGTGEIFGTNGFQDLTLLGGANDFAFDGSFGRGGDVLRFAGDASAYTAAIVGTGVELTDGTSRYSIPIGQEATYLVFADGVRALRFDAGAGEVLLGSQAIGGTPAPITAPDDGSVLPTGADPAVSSRVVLFADAEAGVDGDYTLFGTNAGAETVRYLGGDVSLDGSFGRGGDEVVLTGAAETHTAYLSGTSLVLVTPEGEVTVPVGTAGMDLDFAGDVRTLAFDVGAGAVLIGEQAITATSAGTAQGLTAEGFA